MAPRSPATGDAANLSNASKIFSGLQVDGIAPAIGNSPTLTLQGNSGATTIGIAAPTDILPMIVTVTAVPINGTVLLSDGVTAVAAGETLTAAQLAGLQFLPSYNLFGQSSNLTYNVSDIAGNTASGSAALTIEPATFGPFGGRYVFSQAGILTTLGISNGTLPVFPFPSAGRFNVEVFTASSLLGLLPNLDTVSGVAFNQGVLDPGATLDSKGFLTGANLTLFSGDYVVTDSITGSNTPALITLGSGNQTVVGAPGDTLLGGVGNQTMNGLAGFQSIIGGQGSYTVWGGAGDTVGSTGSTASQANTAQIVGSSNMTVILPSAGNYTIGGATAETVMSSVGVANVQTGAAVVNLAGNSGNESLIATAGNSTITAGGGNASIYGGVGDVITFGTGNQYADGTAGNMAINIGAAGNDTVVGGVNDTITGGAANAFVQYVGAGSIVNFASQTGQIGGINATAGASRITLGAVTGAVVYGGSGDSVAFGSGGNYADGSAGKMLITVGSAGTDTVNGSGVSGAGDTIVGAAGSLRYNVGAGGGDLVNLAGTTGAATINAFLGATAASINDTVIAGNGADTVWGGNGDRIGVGPSSPGGTHAFDHSSGAAVAFGTNDSVTGTSTAHVTVTNFNTTTDTIFYASRTTSNADAAIIAAATTTAGNTTLTLPDGTQMLLAGVASVAALKFTS